MNAPSAAALLDRLPVPERERWQVVRGLQGEIDRVWQSGRVRWPELHCLPVHFVDQLAVALEFGEPTAEWLGRLRAEDLYLAAACRGGDPRAVHAFERHCFAPLQPAAARLAGGVLSAADLEQMLREKLFVGEGGPALASYQGTGDIRTWVRVMAIRLIVDVRRSHDRREGRHRDLPDALPQQNLELLHMKRVYAAQFEQALARSIAMLSERQRNLLRYQLIHALTLNQLAAMYGTHRATIARWLKGARRDVLEQVREDLRRRLGLSPSELDSVMKLIQSDVDASLVKTLLDSTSAG